jgi:hypothetical protein
MNNGEKISKEAMLKSIHVPAGYWWIKDSFFCFKKIKLSRNLRNFC